MKPGQHPGVDDCPNCGKRVLYAVNAGGLVLALDPDESGQFAAWQDTGAARFRHVGASGQLLLGEYLFSRHDSACQTEQAPVAEVRDITTARSLRRPRRRETAERTARAH